MVTIEINRMQGDFGFEATDVNGHTLKMDNTGSPEETNYGASPMQALLMAMGGCTGMDVVAILKKQKQEIAGYRMLIEGEREPDKHPSLWKEIKMIFELSGDIEPEKAKRAAELSLEKYCSVAETLRRAGATIAWEVRVNGVVT